MGDQYQQYHPFSEAKYGEELLGSLANNASSASSITYSSTNYYEFKDDSQPPLDFPQTENVRHTLSSLGWVHGTKTELLKLYAFVVLRGKEPYFELLERWTPTYETPLRVYLDESK
jgi:hypothetical protein